MRLLSLPIIINVISISFRYAAAVVATFEQLWDNFILRWALDKITHMKSVVGIRAFYWFFCVPRLC